VSEAVRVAVPAAQAELAADALWQAGAAAIEEQPGVLIAALGDGGDPAPLVAAVAGRWRAEVVTVDLDGALDAWRPHARAVTVGDRLVVRPPWVDPGVAPGAAPVGAGPVDVAMDVVIDGAVDVVIDPGRAFGHGAHPSTRLVLAALVDLVGGGERVLDVGCGSGVLAIAALALGAGQAVAVDVDPAAVAATRANAARNAVADRLAVLASLDDLDDLPDGAGDLHGGADRAGGYDLVVANMLLPDLVAVAPTIARALAPGGAVVASGLLADQRGALLAAYDRAGLAAHDERADDGWLAVTLRAA
jgi:ribosomal protein L11 methyltransferase